MSKIIKVKARQVYDSRGSPTVEAEVYTSNSSATAICPSGASTGTYEAFEKRDKNNKKYLGKSVLIAVKSINSLISNRLKGYSCLLYTSPSPRDATLSRMPSSA